MESFITVQAATPAPPSGSDLTNLSEGIGLRFGNIADIFSGDVGLISILMAISGFALVIYIVLGGFDLMTSGGDPKKIQSGKAKITHGVLGFMIVLFAYGIIQIIGTVLGLSDIVNIFPN